MNQFFKQKTAIFPKLVALVCLILSILASCGSKTHTPSQKVIDSAVADCENVINAPTGSMQQEHALIMIRVKHNELLSNDFQEEAHDYITTAHQILCDAHILEPDSLTSF